MKFLSPFWTGLNHMVYKQNNSPVHVSDKANSFNLINEFWINSKLSNKVTCPIQNICLRLWRASAHGMQHVYTTFKISSNHASKPHQTYYTITQKSRLTQKKWKKKPMLCLASMEETGLSHDIFFKFSLGPFEVAASKFNSNRHSKKRPRKATVRI